METPPRRKCEELSENHTLYSFRHSGAISVYNQKPNTIFKVQRAINHSSAMVTLNYLKSLGVNELDKEDLPKLRKHTNIQKKSW